MSDPLEQHCRPDLAMQLAQIDRLNLTAQIPELGVVLVGSAKGRVAVLTLHRLDEDVYSFNNNLHDARLHTFYVTSKYLFLSGHPRPTMCSFEVRLNLLP